LAGGTLDLWPIWSFIPNSKTINMAIDIQTSASVEEAGDGIHISAPGIQLEKTIRDLDDYLASPENAKDFFYPHLKHFRPQNCLIRFTSDSPIGAGLGGSSSLTIALMTALANFTNHQWDSPQKQVELAHNMEAFLLKTPTGVQDYYPPILGGTLCLHHHFDGLVYERLEHCLATFQEHFILVYTGRPHHSGMNNWTVLKSLIDGDKKIYDLLVALNEVTNELYEQIQAKNWQSLPKIFQKEYAIRCQLSPAFSSPEIEKVNALALENGAEASKICGAGGGGCVFLWAASKHHTRIKEVMKENGFQVLNAKPVAFGLQVKSQ
tara:strand:- start:1995 stop:2960 length:966 start_codon:yes stop_codon:yes gene_type:complete